MPDYMPLFIDRRDAGRQLASRLKALNLPEPVVYALPRGGVPLAVEIARALARSIQSWRRYPEERRATCSAQNAAQKTVALCTMSEISRPAAGE